MALLVVFALSFPLLVVSYSKTMWLALVVDIIGVQSFFALNEVARDLEDPFVFEPNDIPLAYMQVCLLLEGAHLAAKAHSMTV